MKTFIKFAVIIFFSTLWSSCHKCTEQVNPCPDDLACTEQFVSITVPFDMDSIEIDKIEYSRTYLVKTGEKIFERDYNFQSEFFTNHAVILTDVQMDQVDKEGSELRFEIYGVSGGQLYESTFIIGHDCCHVEKLSGPDKIKF